jgi:hypothetical protein
MRIEQRLAGDHAPTPVLRRHLRAPTARNLLATATADPPVLFVLRDDREGHLSPVILP